MAEESGSEDQTRELSDLVGVELTLALATWFVVMLACFFFVGVVTGMIVLAAGVLGFAWFFIGAVRRAEIRD
jgi:hypothetical protein